ncbi:MAG: hypothetical protein ACFFB5_11335 [Promethearchaeota archaeon]
MTEIPKWVTEWINKDRLVRNKYKLSRKYIQHSKRIQFVEGKKRENGEWISFHFVVNSPKFGKYNVTFNDGEYHCNCPFFKHRLICSHIFGICQKTALWPKKTTVFSNE